MSGCGRYLGDRCQAFGDVFGPLEPLTPTHRFGIHIPQSFVDGAKDALGDCLLLLGEVRGQQKIDFFSSIDVLIFPTSYKSETFPIVLMESLLAGCPIVTTRRGCIPFFQDLESVCVVEDEERFIEEAYQVLCNWLSSSDRLRELKMKAHEEGMRFHMLHSNRLQNLIAEIQSSC